MVTLRRHGSFMRLCRTIYGSLKWQFLLYAVDLAAAHNEYIMAYLQQRININDALSLKALVNVLQALYSYSAKFNKCCH